MDKIDDNYYKKVWIVELIFGVICIGIIVLTKMSVFDKMPNCVFREYLGIICPFCGGTRAVTNLISLNFSKAFSYHPTVVVYLFVLFVGNIMFMIDILRHKKSKININLFIKSFFVFIILTLAQYAIRFYLIKQGVDFGLF